MRKNLSVTGVHETEGAPGLRAWRQACQKKDVLWRAGTRLMIPHLEKPSKTV